MKTNNPKDLRRMMPVASAKAGNPFVKLGKEVHVFQNVRVEDYPDPSEFTSIVMKTIRVEYKANALFVNQLIQWIYGRTDVKFSDCLSEFLIKLTNIMKQTNADIRDIVQGIRNYLGYNCSFNRLAGEKLVPISSERILEAYKLVQQKESLIKVENVLYL